MPLTTRPLAIMEIQTAAHARLTADATLMGMITGIFDAVPLGQSPPYVSYGDHVVIPTPTFGGHWNSEVTFIVDIWSQAPGKEECFRIYAEIYRLLATTPTNPPLTLVNYSLSGMQPEMATTVYETEFYLWHMPVHFLTYAFEK